MVKKKETLDFSEFELPLGELHLKEVQIFPVDGSVKSALEEFRLHRIGSLLVEKAGKLVGIVTERDLLMKSDPAKDYPLEGLGLENLMTPEPAYLTESSPFKEAIFLMATNEFRHIPILDDAGRPKSMISIKDVLGYIIKYFPNTLAKYGVLYNIDNVIEDAHTEAFSSETQEKIEGQLLGNIFLNPLRKVVDTPALCVDYQAPVGEVLAQMQQEKEETVLLVEYNTTLKGIVTERDFLFKIFGADHFKDDTPICNFMTPDPHYLYLKNKIAYAVNNMFTFNYRHLVIVDEDKYPLHVISLLDILKFVGSQIFDFDI